MAKRPRKRSFQLNSLTVSTIGGENAFWSDLYHRAMTARLRDFIVALVAVYVFNNAIFAILYDLDSNAVSNVLEPHLLNLFFFSVESFTTVGFGDMHPVDIWGHLVFSIEGFVSILQLATLTGLIFARFSKPRARIIFADHPIISNHEGMPHLMIRTANARNNFISDATAQLWATRVEFNKEGQRFRRFHELTLTRQQNPAFALSWTLFHEINDKSLLYGLTPKDLAAAEYFFILTIKGVDETSSQDLRARKSYTFEQILWDHRYADILTPGENGALTLDYRKFQKTIKAPA